MSKSKQTIIKYMTQPKEVSPGGDIWGLIFYLGNVAYTIADLQSLMSYWLSSEEVGRGWMDMEKWPPDDLFHLILYLLDSEGRVGWGRGCDLRLISYHFIDFNIVLVILVSQSPVLKFCINYLLLALFHSLTFQLFCRPCIFIAIFYDKTETTHHVTLKRNHSVVFKGFLSQDFHSQPLVENYKCRVDLSPLFNIL